MGGQAVAKIHVGEQMDTRERLLVPRGERGPVPQLGAGKVAKLGEGAGGVGVDSPSGRSHQQGVARLRVTATGEGVFSGQKRPRGGGLVAEGGVGSGVGDVQKRFGGAVGVALSAPERGFG